MRTSILTLTLLTCAGYLGLIIYLCRKGWPSRTFWEGFSSVGRWWVILAALTLGGPVWADTTGHVGASEVAVDWRHISAPRNQSIDFVGVTVINSRTCIIAYTYRGIAISCDWNSPTAKPSRETVAPGSFVAWPGRDWNLSSQNVVCSSKTYPCHLVNESISPTIVCPTAKPSTGK